MSALLLILLTSSVRVALVAALVALVLLATRARGGSVSHAAWTAVLCAMLLMPILPSMARPIAVTVPVSQQAFRVLPEVETPMMPPPVEPTAPVSPAPLEKGAVPLLQVKGAVPLFPAVDWAQAAVVGYFLVVALLLSRLAACAWRVSRLERRADPIEIPGLGARLFSSSLVSVPVTTGVLRPRIILPTDWSSWPSDKLSAVLAHERAHISRRDPLTHWLAYVNRCVFWFHPLAWWLERKLSATAEQACDAEAVRVVGDRKRYAQVLLDMAEAVRRGGGRVAWAGVGIDGAGELGQRIDQVLEGKDPGRISRARKAAIAFGCAAAILLVIACRQQLVATPLKADPEVATNFAEQKTHNQLYETARAMDARQAAELEAAVKKNPEDLAALKRLLIFYDTSGQKTLGWNEMIAARRPHLLWLIEHHPEDDMVVSAALRPQTDPAGYAQAKSLWLAKTTQPDVSTAVLANAARFFQIADKPLAEQLLLRLESSDSNGPTPRVVGTLSREPWVDRLGQLYALTIVGSNDTPYNAVRGVSLEDAHSPYAQEVRRKLDETKDAALLSATGAFLVRNASEAKVDFDHKALGRSYLVRAVQLDPSSSGNRVLKNLVANDQIHGFQVALLAKQRDLIGGEIARKIGAGERLTPADRKALTSVEYQAVSAMPEADRFPFLAWMADDNYMGAESRDHLGDASGASAAWERSKKYAEDAVALAPKFKGDPHYGDAIFEGNVALALHALRGGDVKTAVKYMRAASQANRLSDDLQYLGWSLEQRLVNYLLKAGERESVADFLDQAARLNAFSRKRLLQDAADVHAGRMTMSYQWMLQRN